MAVRLRFVGRVLALAVMAAGVAGAYNVLTDNSALQARAADQACSGARAPCRPALARLLRTPFVQEFDFRVSGQTLRLTCRRTLVLVGAYQCTRAPI